MAGRGSRSGWRVVVITGLVPVIHAFDPMVVVTVSVDGRDKPGQDDL
jgi:hypothetical protein